MDYLVWWWHCSGVNMCNTAISQFHNLHKWTSTRRWMQEEEEKKEEYYLVGRCEQRLNDQTDRYRIIRDEARYLFFVYRKIVNGLRGIGKVREHWCFWWCWWLWLWASIPRIEMKWMNPKWLPRSVARVIRGIDKLEVSLSCAGLEGIEGIREIFVCGL